LRPFGIRPGSVWPVPRHPGAKSAKGYLRSQFEAAWAAYCPGGDSPAQDAKVVWIGRQRGL
jgi:hypothetical protein